MTNADNNIELSRQERWTIADALNRRLRELSAAYAKSCDLGAPNAVLRQEHGNLMRLRDKVLTGQSYGAQDAAAQRAAEASERALRERAQ